MGRSWFYLTLWRGTPEEFTSKIDAKIQTVENSSVAIKTAENLQSKICTATLLSANIKSRETIGLDVIKTTEVVWYVG